jgi:hypothetical protein
VIQSSVSSVSWPFTLTVVHFDAGNAKDLPRLVRDSELIALNALASPALVNIGRTGN